MTRRGERVEGPQGCTVEEGRGRFALWKKKDAKQLSYDMQLSIATGLSWSLFRGIKRAILACRAGPVTPRRSHHRSAASRPCQRMMVGCSFMARRNTHSRTQPKDDMKRRRQRRSAGRARVAPYLFPSLKQSGKNLRGRLGMGVWTPRRLRVLIDHGRNCNAKQKDRRS